MRGGSRVQGGIESLKWVSEVLEDGGSGDGGDGGGGVGADSRFSLIIIIGSSSNNNNNNNSGHVCGLLA